MIQSLTILIIFMLMLLLKARAKIKLLQSDLKFEKSYRKTSVEAAYAVGYRYGLGEIGASEDIQGQKQSPRQNEPHLWG